MGHIPSFCTACYRLGRTGKDFMDLAKPGLIQKFCRTNAILSFKEYLVGYASPGTRKAGEELIAKLILDTEQVKMKSKIEDLVGRIETGERDLYI
jgi:2-iminoacetate synthase